MNGGGRRRFPTTVAANSILVFVISAVTAQQVFDGNQEIDFLRRQSLFQPNQVAFQRNRNFILPSASALRHRNLFTRQISHRHFRSRLRSNSRISTISHQSPSRPSHLTKSARRVLMKNQSRTKQNATANDRSNQRTTKIMSNISRRQNQLQQPLMIQRFQQPVQRAQRVHNQHFPGFRAPVAPVKASPRDAQNQVPTTRTAVSRFSSTRDPFSIRAPLSPMPFGSVQPSSIRRPARPARPAPLISTSQTHTTTTPLPPSTSSTSSSAQPSAILGLLPSAPKINSVGGPLRRPIRVQQLQLNLRRKPQVTRGQFRRPNSKVALTRHQPVHRIPKKPDRVTKPISSTTSEPIATTEADQTTAAATTAEDVQQQAENIDDIEAAILKAIIESSSPEPPPSSTHRQRAHRVRLGKNGNRPLPPTAPRVDAIEEAVLKAVIEASTSAPEVATEGVATATTEPSTTVQKSESSSLFPAFASRRHGRRRLSTTVIPTTEEETTPTALTRTEEAATTPTTELLTTSEEPTTTAVEETTTVMVNEFTIALPDEEFEDINAEPDAENHQIEQIKENIISDLTTPTTASPSPVPPSPLPSILPSSSSSAPPHELPLQPGPPGSMPPSDDIVDELNGSSDFLQVAERLHLLRRLLQ